MNQDDEQEALANTFVGACSQFSEAASNLVETLGEELLAAAVSWQEKLSRLAAAIYEALKQFAETVSVVFVAFTHLFSLYRAERSWLKAHPETEEKIVSWRKHYAGIARHFLRLRVEKYRIIGKPAGKVVDRLPDRLALILFREVY